MTDAIGGDLGLHLAVVDQAQAVPARGCRGLRGLLDGRAGCQFAQQPLVEGLVEGQHKHRRLAIELELGAQQSVALLRAGRRQRRQAQAFDRAFGGLSRHELEALDAPFPARPAGDERGSASWMHVQCYQYAASRADGAVRPPPPAYFLSASRISRSSSTSSGVGAGGAGGAGGAARLSRFTCLTIMKMMKARMTKLMATVMKLP